MRGLRIAAYFLRHGWRLAAGSGRDVVLGVLAIAMALLLWGVVLLVEENLGRSMSTFGGELKVRAYLNPGTSETEQQELMETLSSSTVLEDLRTVAADQAMEELATAFPDLASVSGAGRGVASGYFEWSWLAEVSDEARLALSEEVAAQSSVAWLDDDRPWRGRLLTASARLRTIGVVLAALSVLAAGFVAAAVVRLSAYRHRVELEVERLSGATELYVRAPFLVAGLLQGLAAAGVALGLLYGFWSGTQGLVGDTILTDLIVDQFLSPLRINLVLVVGAAAAMAGAALALGESADS